MRSLLHISYISHLVGLTLPSSPRYVLLDGTEYPGYPAYNSANNPQSIMRAMDNNGPITAVLSAPIACNGENAPAALVANVTAGSIITYTWGSWPEGHKGPIVSLLKISV